MGDEAAWQDAALRATPTEARAAEEEARRAGADEWVACLRARRAIFERHALPIPDPRTHVGESRASVLARAFAVRAALLALDRDRMRAWVALATTDDPLDALSRAWLRAAEHEDVDAVLRDAQAMEQRSRSERVGLAVVDAAALAAFASVEGAGASSALALARRASRMAGAEGIGPLTILAHVVLARARRTSGHPHLAAHIASVVAPVLSTTCREWVTWERVLGAGLRSGDPALGVSGTLGGALEAATAPARADWDRAMADVVGSDAPAFAVADARTLRAAVDHRADPGALGPWASGAIDDVPLGVDGASGEVEGRCYVLAESGHAPRRITAAGVPLARVERAALLVQTVADQARTDSAVSALLLAGAAGVETATLFQRLYGFALVERHRGVLRVLLHRVRARIEGWGTLHHERGVARIDVARAVLFPDPRCERADADVLAVAAHRGNVGAKDLADALGIPLRRAQDALKRLAEAGLFRAVPDGRAMSYVLEDTTFGEPTTFV